MTEHPHPAVFELHRLARLVRELREVQKTYGSGYRPGGSGRAAPLEGRVDAEIGRILGEGPIIAPPGGAK